MVNKRVKSVVNIWLKAVVKMKLKLVVKKRNGASMSKIMTSIVVEEAFVK